MRSDQNSAIYTDSIEWDYLLRSIYDQKCILLIGPEIFPGLHLFDNLCNWLGIDLGNKSISPDIAVRYDRDELFLFTGPDARTRVSGRLGQFYKQHLPIFKPIYEKIAQLPFPVVITTISDDGLCQVFDQVGVSYQFSYYHRKGTPKQYERIVAPPNEHRLLFNLFGKTGERDSVVLTHEDLFDYLKSILGSKPLSDPLYIHLSDTLMEADDFIFLGFQFDRWYMQLLLRLLNPELSKGRQYAFNPELTDETRIFFADQFKVNFINNLTPLEFLNQLCSRWETFESRFTKHFSTKLNLRMLLKQGQLSRILELLIEIFQNNNDNERLSEATLLMARFTELRYQTHEGLILGEHSMLEMNRIRKSTLDLIDNLSD